MKECDRCNCEVSHLNESAHKMSNGQSVMVCDVCYGTLVGFILHNMENQSVDILKTARMLAQVGNLILERINEQRKV